MRITITAINSETPALVPGTSALGWRGKFGCPLGIGDVIYVASAGDEANLRVGSTIAVKTSFEYVNSVSFTSALLNDCLEPVSSQGDYKVRGRVVSVAPEGRVQISVRGLLFDLERESLDGAKPKVNDYAEFQLYGLVFWDKGSDL